MEFLEKIIFKLLGGSELENKLMRCQNYSQNSIVAWKSQTDLNWFQTIKFLKAIKVFDANAIRATIHTIVENNLELFKRPNLFITSFGSEGKSGSKIAYEFRHTKLVNENKFINAWDLTRLPESSTVIFVEDLIGTGTQSTEYILDKLNLLLNPSSDPFLLTICATSEGIEKVRSETNFKVINGIELFENEYQHFSENCNYFNAKEKEKLLHLNNNLKKAGRRDFDKGLLVTFHYSPPNNSMPVLWKHNYTYTTLKGEEKKWVALLPREY